MRVLHAADPADFGGGEPQCLRLVLELERRGVENHVLLRGGGELERRLAGRLPAGRLHRLAPGPPALGLPLGWAWLGRRLKPDVAHAHTGRSALGIRLCGARASVVHRRIPDPPSPGGLARMAAVDGVLCVSEEIRRRLLATGLGASGRPRVAAVLSSVETPERPAAAAGLDGDPVVGFVGHFRRHKGLDTLLDALPAVLAGRPGLRLHLVGRGAEETALRRQAERLGVAEALRWHGFQADPLPWIAGLDLLAMPSREEGLGTIALTAQALGVPVLATTAGGIPEGVAHGETGWLVPPEDPAALAEALGRLAGDRALRERLGAAGPARIAREFGLAAMAAKTLAFYEERLADRAAAGGRR